MLSWHPPTNAPSHSPFSMACKARCMAVNDELHAVSRKRDGPVISNTYEILFAIVLAGVAMVLSIVLSWCYFRELVSRDVNFGE